MNMINSLAAGMGVNGRGYAQIARETEKAVSCVKDAELIIQRLVDEADVSEDGLKSAQTALVSLSDSAFKTNINAFNMSVEAMRSGNIDESAECGSAAVAYAGGIWRTYKTCKNLIEDSAKLAELLHDEGNNTNDSRFQKQHDDIIWQFEFLNMQLRLESERAGLDCLRALAHDFGKMLEDFKHGAKVDLPPLIKQGEIAVEAAGARGAVISYILDEYRNQPLLEFFTSIKYN
jgi:hypothetical protein